MLKNPILVALDVSGLDEALELVAQTRDYVGGYKIGLELCMSVGMPQAIEAISAAGGSLFVDVKLKDIPNTVAAASRALARKGVLMFNVHADGGLAMMRAARAAITSGSSLLENEKPLIIGVTVLTSIGDNVLRDELEVPATAGELAVRLAKLAREAGLDGVVCSAHDIVAIKSACGSDFRAIVPGIRPTWAASHDQVRTMTPAEAVQAGADYLVIGRPITHPPASVGTPAIAASLITEEIGLL
jgi:orotidine-5'-phosphate decarboxylase